MSGARGFPGPGSERRSADHHDEPRDPSGRPAGARVDSLFYILIFLFYVAPVSCACRGRCRAGGRARCHGTASHPGRCSKSCLIFNWMGKFDHAEAVATPVVPGRSSPSRILLRFAPDFPTFHPNGKRAGIARERPIQATADASWIDGLRRERSRLLSASAGFSTKCHDSIASGMVRPQASMKLGNTAIGPKCHTSVCCTA